VPAALVLLLVMVVGPTMRWTQDNPVRVFRAAVPPVAVGCLLVVVLVAVTRLPASAVAVLGLAVAVVTTAVQTAVRRRGAARAGHLAHAAFALVVAAVAVSSTATRSVERSLEVGQRASVGSASVQLLGVGTRDDARSSTVYARLALRRAGHGTRTVEPGLRTYPAREMTVAVPAISAGVTGDVYVTVLDVATDDRSVTLRLAVDPLVDWVWAGGALLALAGVLAALGRGAARLRLPPRPRRGVSEEQLPEERVSEPVEEPV
jgi:cytochrome c-type biogenesis protein CcmF